MVSFFFKLKYPVVIVNLLTLLDTCSLPAVLCDPSLIILMAGLYSTNNIMTNSQQRKLSYREKNYLLRFTYLLRRKCRIGNWGIWQSVHYEGLQYPFYLWYQAVFSSFAVSGESMINHINPIKIYWTTTKFQTFYQILILKPEGLLSNSSRYPCQLILRSYDFNFHIMDS